MLFIGLGAYFGSKKSPGWAAAGAIGGAIVANTLGVMIAKKLMDESPQVQAGYGGSPMIAGRYSVIAG